MGVVSKFLHAFGMHLLHPYAMVHWYLHLLETIHFIIWIRPCNVSCQPYISAMHVHGCVCMSRQGRMRRRGHATCIDGKNNVNCYRVLYNGEFMGFVVIVTIHYCTPHNRAFHIRNALKTCKDSAKILYYFCPIELVQTEKPRSHMARNLTITYISPAIQAITGVACPLLVYTPLVTCCQHNACCMCMCLCMCVYTLACERRGLKWVLIIV